MPQTGLCVDITCDKEVKQLYECHCCNRLICLNHLIEHVEIKKQNKERSDILRHELITVTTTLKLITEKKLREIDRENKLIEQAKKILDVQICSIDEIQNIFEQINQAIASNRSEEAIVKVESSLSDVEHYACINEKKSQKDHSPIDNSYSETKSPVCFDLTCDTDECEKSAMTKSHEYSKYDEEGFLDKILLDQTEDYLKDEAEDEEPNKINPPSEIKGFGQCPLIFNGAYGLPSIRLCSKDKLRAIGLYGHFINKHHLKAIHARRLMQAISKGQDPMTTKLFDEDEDVINHFHKISCPFKYGMINLFGCNQKQLLKVPCRHKSVLFNGLKIHLKHYHKVPAHLAQTLYNHFKEMQAKQ